MPLCPPSLYKSTPTHYPKQSPPCAHAPATHSPCCLSAIPAAAWWNLKQYFAFYPPFAGDPLPAEKRRRWFDNPTNASSVLMSKDYVYTWHIWQHWCNISTYRLQLSSFFGVDLCNFSEGQPMQIMAKDSKVCTAQRWTVQYMCTVLCWH